MYIELKTGYSDDGPAWIGYVRTSKTKKTIYFNDHSVKLKEEIRKVENKYEDEIYQLEKENSLLRKVINTFQKTVDKFIHWVCSKFSVSSEEEFIRDFEFENDIYLDPEKQIEHEEELEYEEMEW